MHRPALTVGAAIVAASVFAFRFLSFRDLSNDHYMYLAWARQILAGDWPGRDFVEPGMPLAILVSVAGQWLQPGPFGEAVVTMAMLGLATGCAYWLVAGATGSITAGLLAAGVQIVLLPRLYSFPKMLVPAVALLLLLYYARTPTTLRLAALAAWTVASFLLRHDLGLMAAAALVSGLVFSHDNWLVRRRAIGRYVVLGLAFVSPYLAYVQWAEGIGEHVHVSRQFASAEAHQLIFDDFPPVPSLATIWSGPENGDDAATILFWLFHTAAAVTLIQVPFVRRNRQLAGLMVASAVFLIAFRFVIVRHPLVGRMGDAGAILGIVLALSAAISISGLTERWYLRLLAGPAVALCVLLVVGTFRAGWTLSRLPDEIDEAGVAKGWSAIAAQWVSVTEAGRSADWHRYWPAGDVPQVIPYLRECTAPSQRILMTWPAPEYHVFSRRPFAAGHALLMHTSFNTDRDQSRMLARLDREDVPIVLYNESRRDEFDEPFPQLAAHVRTRYEARGRFTIRDGSEITILVQRRLQSGGSFAETGWPCHFAVKTP